MKKGIVAGLIVLCVALGAGTAAVVVTDDRKGPEIELPKYYVTLLSRYKLKEKKR